MQLPFPLNTNKTMQLQLVKKFLNDARHHSHRGTATIFPLHRLLSSSIHSTKSNLAPIDKPASQSQFAVEYLINSCGLTPEKAIKASIYIPRLKSPAKPDSVLQFLRESGLTDSHITRAVSPNPRILCIDLEKNMKPRITELQEIGLSPSQIAQLVSLSPSTFMSMSGCSLQRKIQFWMPILGSFEGILSSLKNAPYLLTVSVEKVIEPNISFLEEHCGVSPIQIRKFISRDPSLITYNPNKLKEAAQRAEELGSPRGSGLFLYALNITSRRTPSNLVAKVKNLKKLGFSEEEIGLLIKKHPMLLSNSDERLRKSIDFLTTEAGLDLPYIARRPCLLSYSLERRIIPRHYVLKSLKSKGLLENFSFYSALCSSEEKFEVKFVRPYKDIIPEVCEAYEAALAAKTSVKGKL